jgi:hypothetical protein
MATNIAGGCLCGAVRYQSSAPPVTARFCWCRLCQYLGAGNATVNVVFETANFTATGTTTDYVSTADSGNKMHRRFCPDCGTPVFSSAEIRPNVIIVRAGTLDDPNIAQPAIAIWTGQAPRYACIDPDLPTTPGQPPPA